MVMARSYSPQTRLLGDLDVGFSFQKAEERGLSTASRWSRQIAAGFIDKADQFLPGLSVPRPNNISTGLPGDVRRFSFFSRCDG